MAKGSGTTRSVGSGSATRTTARGSRSVSIDFSKIGTTRMGDYEVEVRGSFSQDRNKRGLNISSELYTEIRKDGKIVAWNSTQPGGEKQREAWIKEQRKKFKI